MMGTLPIKDIIMNRMMNFFVSGLKHSCTIISDFFKNVLLSNSSHMTTNINTILQYLNIRSSDLFNLTKSQIKLNFESKSDEIDWRCNFIRELLSIRENQLSVDLSKNEINAMLEYVSTFR